MPPKSRPALTADQITALRKWITAGAPAFPADAKRAEPEKQKAEAGSEEESPNAKEDFAAEKAVLNAILEHTRATDKQDRRFVRFFSIRHLLDSGVTPQRLEELRVAFAKAINHLSRERQIVVPQPIDASKTVFAVDIRKLGWHRKKLQNLEDKDESLNLFDLVLLEYPYAILPADSDAFDDVRTEFLNEAKQVRPIPFVRADWFCSVVLQPPLYHDMLELPLTLEELEEDLGVDVQSNLDSGLAKRAGMTVSGVSRNNRVAERHPHADGYYWKSHDFQSNLGSENILKDPIDFVPSGGEMIFRLPNGMQGYYVSDARGDRLDAAPTSIVVDKFASDRVVRNGLGCIRCHRAGIKDFSDSVRSVVEKLTGNPGFDKRKALQLYPTHDQWDKQISADQALFLTALKKLGQADARREPLSIITADYLEGTLTVDEAAAELGVDAEQLKVSCRAPGFTRLGLAPLASGSVIRRDAWEDNFDAAAALLGAGTPVVPIDGNQKRDFVPDPKLDKIELTTNKKNNFFEPGDELRISVTNNSRVDITFELYGTSVEGKKVRLTSGVAKLSVGESFTFPEQADQAIEVRGGLGREEITLFASTGELPAGHIFRGKNMADRVVHEFFSDGNSLRGTNDVVKKTILIETR